MIPCTCAAKTEIPCKACQLYATSVRHKYFWDTGEIAVCDHLGEQVLCVDAKRLELSTIKIWQPCALGYGKNGYIAKCDTICLTCKDFCVNGIKDKN